MLIIEAPQLQINYRVFYAEFLLLSAVTIITRVFEHVEVFRSTGSRIAWSSQERERFHPRF